MTNVEKYLQDFIGCDDKMELLIKLADKNPCSIKSLLDWLFDDYVEKTLENADGIISGQKIMVRDYIGDVWVKCTFVGYWNETFYVLNSLFPQMCKGYKQARLPKEGE